jgi:hypothetical protein
MVGPDAPTGGKIFLSTVQKPTDLGIAMSIIMVEKSYLHKSKNWRNGKICKELTGMLLTQEDVLQESLFGMALHFFEIKGPKDGGWIRFNCRPLDSSKSEIALLLCISLMLFFIYRCQAEPQETLDD